jgi:HEAT repeat protein
MIQSAEAAPALREALVDSVPEVRAEAARALGALGDPSLGESSRGALKDANVVVRLQAAQSLMRLGDSSGLPVAYAALKDADPSIRSQAAVVAGQMGDADAGLPALEAAFAAETDPNTKSVIDFSRAQLKARLGIKAAPPQPAGLPSAAAKVPDKPAPKPKGKSKR